MTECTRAGGERRPGGRSVGGAIDADVHPYFRHGLRDLEPYLDDAWSYVLRIGEQSLPDGFPNSTFTLPTTHYINPGGGLRGDAASPSGGPPASDPVFVAKELFDGYGFGAASLIGGNLLALGGVANPNLAAALAGAHNHWLADRWLATDDRFLGSIYVAPQAPEHAVREIRKWAAHPRMAQVFVPNSNTLLGKPHFHQIYRAAAGAGLPIAAHPGGSLAGVNGYMTAVEAPTTYIEYHTAIPQIFQAHAISLVVEGVLESFPDLRFGLLEGGFAWLPHVMWRLDKNWRGLRAEVPWLRRRPSEYLRESLRLTTQPLYEPDDPRDVERVIDLAGAQDMVMFSTDYPHWDFDSPTESLRRLPADLTDRMMRRTPQAYFRRPTDRPES
ncbi:MAG: amidohydrolase family protein [Pseudonocardia sp.]